MITNKKGIEGLKKLNTHKCKKCGTIFKNFKGINEHSKKHKHYQFDLLNEGGFRLI